jgi:SAM-dependent methyltransferase
MAKRLNLGCGRDLRADGWLNVDQHKPEILPPNTLFHEADLNSPAWGLGIADDTIDLSEGSHVIEHLTDPMAFMAELWRVTKPGGMATFWLPYGSSDDAWEDPTHVRPYFVGSFAPFSQGYYWRADYGYRGDWAVDKIELQVWAHRVANADGSQMNPTEVVEVINIERNVVHQMVVTLSTVKPIRKPDRALLTAPKVALSLVR